MTDYMLAAKYAYQSHCANFPDAPSIPWQNLDEESKDRWCSIARAAAHATPAPLAGMISINLPAGCQPIQRFYRSDTTKESIHEACVELEKWLLEISESWREQAVEVVREDRSVGKFKEAPPPKDGD
jgi:hypothetical protein